MKIGVADLVSDCKAKQAWLLELLNEISALSGQVQEDTTKVLEEVESKLNCLISILESRRDMLRKLLTSDMDEKDEIFTLQASTVTHLLYIVDKLLKAEQDVAADPENFISWTEEVKRFIKSADEARSFWKFPKAPCFEMDLDGNKQQLEAVGKLIFADTDAIGPRTQEAVAPPQMQGVAPPQPDAAAPPPQP
eukprot:CAMPEP_0196655410 /NCGR_PEP_ID=MMETSP1086-20130531/5162_1 /TAXON_ID=77921 /ORGANISM="Cyanoptyche  gloeocystis , Strain SAG4.97" /LENGTH=192 /DNA_ID=CAMNT_0041987701 /DNA_START=646 /DNA_END=1220 /DNA_ORIENTATION=+